MRPLPHAILALGLVSAGVFLGRWVKAHPAEVASTRKAVENRPERPRPENGTGRPAATGAAGLAHNLAGLRERLRAWNNMPAELPGQLERMSVEGLHGMITELLAMPPDDPFGSGSSQRYRVMQAAIRELLRREGAAALEWAGSMKEGPARQEALEKMLRLAARNLPDSAHAWMARYEKEYGADKSTRDQVEYEMVQGSHRKGADEMIRVFRMLDDYRGSPLHNAEFPPDFDFPKMHAALAGNKASMLYLYAAWSARDPEAAWKTLSGDAEALRDGIGINGLLVGMVAKQGEAEGAKAAAAHLASLTAEHRQAALRHTTQLLELTPTGLSAISAALPAEDQKALAKGIVGATKDARKAIAVLEALPRQEMLEVLGGKQWRQVVHRMSEDIVFSDPGAGTPALLNEIGKHFSLTEEEMKAVQAGAGDRRPFR